MKWEDKIKEFILPVSNEQMSVTKALKEWFYTGDCYDLGDPAEICEICGYEYIRYQFKIRNKLNTKELLIGSECITKFDISVLDEKGQRLNKDDAKKAVQKDRAKLIKEAAFKSVLNSLILLKQKEENLDINSFLNYYQEHEKFTPKQLCTIIWRLEKYKITYQKRFFKMKLRRNVEKDVFIKLPRWQFDKIKPCLTKYQIEIYEKYQIQ